MPADLAKPRSRLALGIVLGVVVALGLSSRRFGTVLPDFIVANAGDTLWTVAVYLTIAFATPKWPPVKIGLWALGISVAVELSQLVDASWLNAIRQTLPGRLLLGAGFLWVDLLRYFAGAVLATALDWLRRIWTAVL